MKISVVVNPSAGGVNTKFVVEKIQDALYRCELLFFKEHGVEKLLNFLRKSIDEACDCIVIVGGDGTINLVGNLVMRLVGEGRVAPPLCLVSSGTANDLAHELGVNLRIEKAVQSIFSDRVVTVDLLKVVAGQTTKYMLTNGGVGLTAETAKSVNTLRDRMEQSAQSLKSVDKNIGKLSQKMTDRLGANIYNLMLIKKWLTWPRGWKVKIQWDEDDGIITDSPFVLVNNQKKLAQRFYTAPSTYNDDGRFSLLILKKEKGTFNQVKNVLKLSRGRWANPEDVISKEVSRVRFSCVSEQGSLDFIGDGELLQQAVNEVEVTCVHPGLKIVQAKELQK